MTRKTLRRSVIDMDDHVFSMLVSRNSQRDTYLMVTTLGYAHRVSESAGTLARA